MKFSILLALLAAAGVILAAPQATAQSNSEGWQFTIAPYLWAAGMDGSITVARFEEGIDASFSDITSNLDIAGMLHFDMQNEHWVVTSDLVYVDLGADADVTRGTESATVKQTLFEVAGGYRVSPALTVLAGARWVGLETWLRYEGQHIEREVDEGKSWIDPFVGVHLKAPLAERWWLGVHGDIGGFGVGSDLAWQAYADIGFKASKVVSVDRRISRSRHGLRGRQRARSLRLRHADRRPTDRCRISILRLSRDQGGKRMWIIRGFVIVVMVALAGATVWADDLTGSTRFLCSSVQVTVCYEDGECVIDLPWNVNVPEFVEVDLEAKRLSTTAASELNRATPIEHLLREDGNIVLQGYEMGRAFSWVITEQTGQVTAAMATEGGAVVVFGACTPMTAAGEPGRD